MAISLYDLTVASYLQTLGAVSGFLERGLAHCRDNNIDPEEVADGRVKNCHLARLLISLIRTARPLRASTAWISRSTAL